MFCGPGGGVACLSDAGVCGNDGSGAFGVSALVLCGGVVRGALCCVFLDGVGGSDGISITSSDELSTSTISSNLGGDLTAIWFVGFGSGDEARFVPAEDEIGTVFALRSGTVNRACLGSGGFTPEELPDCAGAELVV